MIDMRMHHIGIVVPDIATSKDYYETELGLTVQSGVSVDPIQKVKVMFLRHPDESVAYELIEPLGDDSPVINTLKSKNRLAHVCYEVTNLENKIESLRNSGHILISGPVSAVAFDGRRIAFLYSPERVVIELVETGELV